jgi:formylglycine-generating enzyme required for sulfatase activity
LIGQEPWALRGGSWNNNQNNARVDVRNNNRPNNQWNNNGFRLVVVSPHNFALCR